jgi:hypothetical protein
MTDHYMAYQQSQLKQAGDDSTTTAEHMDAHVANHNAQTEALGPWPNPYKDPNDLVAGVIEAAVSAFTQVKTDTGSHNVDAHQQDSATIQATHATIAEAESVNNGLVQKV